MRWTEVRRGQLNKFDFDAVGDKFQYLSRDPRLNPMMHDWNHVFLPYCDGGGWR